MKEHPAVRTVVAPYDSGHRGLRMGAGPGHLMNNGLPEVLRSAERPSLSFADVLPEVDPPAEVATAFELDRLVSEQVREALTEDEFPLVLSGNCNTSVGTIAGLGPGDLGVVWFDAHADFNTPETTATGFADGMGLSIAVGHCWKGMAGGIPGFTPVAEENVVLAGARAVEPSEEERLAVSDVAVVGAERIGREGPSALEAALGRLGSRVGRVYVHLDLDVLDPEKVGKANQFAPEGGLSAEELQTALGMVQESFDVAAAGIASYDPAFDADGCVLSAALACARCSPSRRSPPSRDRLRGLLRRLCALRAGSTRPRGSKRAPAAGLRDADGCRRRTPPDGAPCASRCRRGRPARTV